MDDEQFYEDDPDLSAQDADDEDDAEDSPSDEDEPFDADDDGDDDETDESDDELSRLRDEIAERDRMDRERAERETQDRYRAQRESEYRAVQQEQKDRYDAVAIRNAKRAQVNRQLAVDMVEADKSGDPAWARQFYLQQHHNAMAAVDHEYDTWLTNYNAAVNRNKDALIQQSNRTAYAEHVRQAMGLPASAINQIMFYANGDPVRDVNDFPARAAEIYERRKEQANRKRAQTNRQKDEAREQRRGKSGVSGAARAPVNLHEITDENAGDLLRQGWAQQQTPRRRRSA